MKKILFIIMLMGAFSLSGKTQSTQMKFYVFEYPSFSDDTYWYQDIDLYVDGALYSSFRIGNPKDMLLNNGFTVPVGSSWYLHIKNSYATRHGMACACPVAHTVTSGKATDSTTERLYLIRPGEG